MKNICPKNKMPKQKRKSLHEYFPEQDPENSEPEYLMGIAYEIWDTEAIENDTPQEKGWEVPYKRSNVQSIIEDSNAYGIQTNERGFEHSHFWDNEHDPANDEMTGAKTYYKMFIKHLDGSDLSDEEALHMNELIAVE